MFTKGDRIKSVGNTPNMLYPGKTGTVLGLFKHGDSASRNSHDRSDLYQVCFDGGPPLWHMREYEITLVGPAEENFYLDA